MAEADRPDTLSQAAADFKGDMEKAEFSMLAYVYMYMDINIMHI